MKKKKFILEPKISPAKKRRDQARATKLLSQIRSYEEWIAEPDTRGRAALKSLCEQSPELFGGSLREFYDKFVGQLVRIQQQGDPTEYVARKLGRMGGKASAKALTAAERTERARKAGLAGGRGRTKKGGKR
jgi:hypothetical protein